MEMTIITYGCLVVFEYLSRCSGREVDVLPTLQSFEVGSEFIQDIDLVFAIAQGVYERHRGSTYEALANQKAVNASYAYLRVTKTRQVTSGG